MKAFRRIAQAFLLLGLVLGVWAFWWEPRRLVVREVPLELAGWPREMSGLRVALLTDLHVGGPFNGLPRLREVVRRTNERHPDLILLLGDYMKGHILGQVVTPEEMAPEMGQLEAPLGVFAVLGNHDHWFNSRHVARALQNAGITVLENQARRVSFRGAGIWIGGISDFWEGKPDFRGTLKQVTDDAPVILMTHNPDLFPETPARVSLLLAGHTHGGQVRFPFLGALVVPSIYGNRYLAGHIEERGQHLFVATGIGMSYLPVRFGVPPEVTILRIDSPGIR